MIEGFQPQCGGNTNHARLRLAAGMRAMPASVSYACPSWSHKLDIQGIELGSRIVFDLWCHGCGAHITMRLKP